MISTRAVIHFVKVIVFLSGLLVILHFLTDPYRDFLNYKDQYGEKFQGLGPGVTTLMLGDSRPGNIPQEMLPKGMYNFAQAGDSAREMLIKLRYALMASPGIQTVLLSVDDHLLSDYRSDNSNQKAIAYYCDREIYKAVYKKEPEISVLSDVYRKFPLLSPDIYVFCRHRITYLIEKAFSRQPEGTDTEWAGLDGDTRQRKADHRVINHFMNKISPDLEAVLSEIVGLCRERGIKVIGVRYPLSEAYRRAAAKYDLLPRRQFVSALIGSDVIDMMDMLGDEFFLDTDHVNEEGAAKVVERLNKQVGSLY